MQQYINALIYIAIGLVGAYCHYFKKRHIDNTTEAGFLLYLRGHYPSTIYALSGIIFAEINLSFLQEGSLISLKEVMGAATLGYTLDSGINKAPEQVK